jgi:hypothetical protein
MATGDLTVRVDMDAIEALLGLILGRLDTMATQGDIDRIAATLGDVADRLTAGQQALEANSAELTAAVSDIRDDIAAIKAGATLDGTSLEANAARLGTVATSLGVTSGQLTGAVDSAQQLAGENPPPAP